MILVRLISILPFWLLYALGKGISFLLYHVSRYRRGVVHKNLSKAFPGVALSQLRSYEKAFYIQFVQVFIESVKAYRFKKKDWEERVPLKNPELLMDYLDKGQPIILLSGHTANWEWPAFSIGQQLNYPMEFLYKPVKNEKADRLMLNLRTLHGGRAIPKDTALRQIIKRKTEPRIVGILADQLPSIGADKYWINFLNQPTAFYTGPQKIARIVNYPVFYSETRRTSTGRYEVIFHRVMEPPYEKEGRYIVESFAQLLEQTIRKYPSDYLWSHKRWKYDQIREKEVLAAGARIKKNGSN